MHILLSENFKCINCSLKSYLKTSQYLHRALFNLVLKVVESILLYLMVISEQKTSQ